MRVVHLSDSWPWFGAFSGYGQLTRYVSALATDVDVVHGRRGLHARLAGSARALSHLELWRLGSRHPATQANYERLRRARPDAVCHLLYGEAHHDYLGRWRRAPENLVATLHHPPEHHPRFHRSLRDNLARLRRAIVLYRRDVPRFERWVGAGRVHVVPHGVDVDFFSPDTPEQRDRSAQRTPRILYVGSHGRDVARFVRLASDLLRSHPRVEFDLVVPKGRGRLWRLLGHPRVHWHRGVSDEALRELYRRARLLLIPLSQPAANNALLEALACGLPVVVNRTAGDPDYGGGVAYPLPADRGDDALLGLVGRYLADPTYALDVGRACRTFATEQLDWRLVARRHVAIYELMSSSVR